MPSITVNFSAEAAARIEATWLGTGKVAEDATLADIGADIKQTWVRDLKREVRKYEERQAAKAAEAARVAGEVELT